MNSIGIPGRSSGLALPPFSHDWHLIQSINASKRRKIESAYCNGKGIGTIAYTCRSLGDVLTNSWFI